MPPTHQTVVGLCWCGAAMSNVSSRQSDEPFTICDIQFDDPQIGVLGLTPVQVIIDKSFIFSVFSARLSPIAVSIGAWHAFENPPVCAIFRTNYNDCSGFAFTLVEHGGETASTRNLAQQARYFEVCGEPRCHAGRVSPAGQAASQSMLLASSA